MKKFFNYLSLSLVLVMITTFINPSFQLYDKYMNRDFNINLRSETAFYSSKYLYSSHYMKLVSYNNSSIIFH